MSDYKQVKLISIYMYISELYEMELQYCCQRQSNNSSPEFTDQEVMSIYLFAITEQKYFLVKDIYLFTKEYTCACAQYKYAFMVSKTAFLSGV